VYARLQVSFLGISDGFRGGFLRGLARLSSSFERVADKSIAEFCLWVLRKRMHLKMMSTLAVKVDPLPTIETRGVPVVMMMTAIVIDLYDVSGFTFPIIIITRSFGVSICQFMNRYTSCRGKLRSFQMLGCQILASCLI